MWLWLWVLSIHKFFILFIKWELSITTLFKRFLDILIFLGVISLKITLIGIKGAYIGHTYIKNSYARITYNRDIFINNTCIRNMFL